MNDLSQLKPEEAHASLQRNGTLYTVRPLKGDQSPQRYLCTVSKVLDSAGCSLPVRVGNTLVLLSTRKGFSTFLEYVGFRKEAIQRMFQEGASGVSAVKSRWD